MQVDIQRSSERGATKTSWLNSRHSFSFANYLNPARMGFGLLRALNEDVIEPGGGFPTHHHDNMEIITIVLEGTLQHKDSAGTEGTIREGEVQHMSAGRGIYHSEFNTSQQRLHLLQVWIEAKQQDIKSFYQQKRTKLKKNALVEVAGKNSMQINQDAALLIGELSKNVEVFHNIAQDQGAYVFVISGEIDIGRYKLSKGDAASITDTKLFSLKAADDCKVLVIDVPME